MSRDMKRLRYFFYCVLAVFILLTYPLSDRLQAEEIKDAKKLFETKCSHCHTLDYAKSKRYSRKEWTKTVTRMREHGSDLKDGEAEKIIDYLVSLNIHTGTNN